MKRIGLLFVLIVCVMMAGCTENPPDAADTEVSTSASGTMPSTTAAPEEPEIPSEPETQPPSDPEPPEIDDAFWGTVQDNTYTSDYIGIACKLDENWQIYSGKTGETFENQTQLYDMQANNTQNNANMHIVLTQLSDIEQLAYADASQEEIVDITLQNSAAITQSYLDAGMTVKTMTKEQFDFLGEHRFVVYTVCDLKGVDYHIVQLFCYDLGAYGATLTVAGFNLQTVQDILALFYKI